MNDYAVIFHKPLISFFQKGGEIMNEKKLQIIEAGLKLYSEKGFHNTTIQEIATQCGISKGAFYLHFDSKESLALGMFKFYYQSVMDKVRSAQDEGIEPRQSLTKQIQVLLETFIENKEFIVMHMRGHVSLGDKVTSFVEHIKKESFQWTSENLLAIYGEKIRPFLVDASILLDGIISSHLKWLIINDLTIDTKRISQFITRRVDDCINGLLAQEEKPQISIQEFTKNFLTLNEENHSVRDTLKHMKEILQKLTIEKKRSEDLHAVIDLLIQEEQKDEPQLVIFQGMLTHFKEIPEMKDDCEMIIRQLNIQLL